MKKTITPGDARMGMRVLGFEGSWLHHPFWKSNFVIEDEATLQRVQNASVYGVVIDASTAPAPSPAPAANEAPAAAPIAARAAAPATGPASALSPILQARNAAPAPAGRAANGSDVEVERARTVIHRARQVMFRVFEQARLGRAVKASDVSAVVDEITDTVLLHPGAMLNVARLKTKTEYTYMHSVAVCTLMVNLAKTLNLPESQYRAIGLAGLMHDVGKVAIPLDILDKAGSLTDEEYAQIKQHTLKGRELIADSADMPDIALDVCAHHHEKIDGTGYPYGHRGEEISRYARMGAICDVYDALTSERVYKSGWQPQEALTAMGEWQGHFDRDIFFQFQRSVGIFPVGMLVELRSQRLAIIMPNGRRNSRPRARAFYDLRANDFLVPEDVQLDESMRHDQALREASPARIGAVDWPAMREALMTGKDVRYLMDRAA